MTEQWVPSKAELLERLRASRDHVLATVRALPAESLELGTVRERLERPTGLGPRRLHRMDLPAADRTSPARRGRQRRPRGAVNSRSAPCGVESMLTMTGKWRGAPTCRRRSCSTSSSGTAPPPSARSRPRTRSYSGVPIRSAGGFTGPLAAVFHAVAVEHVLGHIRDIAGSGSAAR